ncbi:MAG: hypothetical protein J6B29_04015 [Clostridia bacterium]|nr:hypothetical protein [Clostridia bacterium]
MRRIFVILCPTDNLTFLPEGMYTELFRSPLYEHAYKKIENAVRALNIECEIVRSSSCGIPNTASEINAGLEDIVIFASPYVFLARNADVEGAINYITKTDLGYSTVGTDRSLYMTVGLSKMISRSTVGTPYEFISAITDSGARCPHANFADSEPSLPKSRLDFYQKVERYRREFLEYLIRFGVNIEALDGIVISPTVQVERGATIYTGCRISGESIICAGSVTGPNATVHGSKIGESSVVGACRVENSVIEKDVTVEDYCIIKGGSHLISGTKVASHCEIVNSLILADCRVSSHCHIWDSEIGSRTVIGSGVVTINYETNRKQSKCVIGEGAIIGCNSNLVLPIEIGNGALIAAGSTVTDNVPAGALAIARPHQTNRNGWAKRMRNHGKHF